MAKSKAKAEEVRDALPEALASTRSLAITGTEAGAAEDVLPPRKRRKEVSLTMRLDEPTMEWLEEAARRRGLGVSTVARMFMLKGLSEEPSPESGDWVS